MAKSLASGTEVKPEYAMELPPELENAPLEVVATKAIAPYVTFAQPKASAQWTDLATKLPGLQDGDAVLVMPEPDRPLRLQPMRFTLMACRQYWIQKDQAGNPVPGVKPSLTQMPRTDRWQEQVFCAALVYVQHPDRVEAMPVTVTFKTVKCPAALSVKLQVDAAEKPEWADLSTTHKLAFGVMQKPFLRVVGTVTTTTRTSGKGFSYVGARAVVSPSTPTEWKAVKDLLEFKGDPNVPVTQRTWAQSSGMDRFRLVSSAYHSRLAEIGIPAK